MLFEKVVCRSTGQSLSCYSYKMKRSKTLVYRLVASEITCSLKQIKQCRQMTPLCCVGTVGVGCGGTVGVGWVALLGWVGWQLIVGVSISNSSLEYLQPEGVISCNYPPGYLPSDPTS